ncbi:MAG: hypothetical protein ABSG57_07740 [Candidatus Bathyarchaeia archaeon]
MKAEKIQAAKKRILALLGELPYWKATTLEQFLVRKQHVMSRGVYVKAILDLLQSEDLVQPRAGVICRCAERRCLIAPARSEELCEERRVDLLLNGEPISSPVVTKTCRHHWELILNDGMFALTCSECEGSVRAWCSMPTCLSDVLTAVAQLPEGSVNEETIKQAAQSVHPHDKASAWDTFATIKTVLAMKSGQPNEALWIKSKILSKFLEIYKNESGSKVAPPTTTNSLAMLSRSTQRRFGFAVRALQDLPVWFQP